MKHKTLLDIVGLEVHSIRGTTRGRGKQVYPIVVLFSDGKTYLLLEEQDYYSYHDCSSSARELEVHESEEEWERYSVLPVANAV